MAAATYLKDLWHQPVLYITLWIFFSSCTILFNNYVFNDLKFPFPIFLTTFHLTFATIGTRLLRTCTTMLNSLDAQRMSWREYAHSVLPIAIFFSASLILSNKAYLYLEVSFIQMLKATTPVVVLVISWILRTEKPNATIFLNVVVIVFGVAVASYYEVAYVWIGFIFQAAGIICEGTRLVLVQKLLNDNRWKMDPLCSLYYFAPICALFNGILFCFLELPSLSVERIHSVGVPILFANAATAFCLNVALVFLIGKTSSLVLTLAGVLKDILLVAASVAIWHSRVTPLQVFGYSIALSGLVVYKNRASMESSLNLASSSRTAANWHTRCMMKSMIGALSICLIISALLPRSSNDAVTTPSAALRQNPIGTFLANQPAAPPVGTTLVVTMADESYFDAILNLEMSLDSFGWKSRLLILCLTESCMELCKEHQILCFGGYIPEETGQAMMAEIVPRAKLPGVRDVLEAGYPILFLDADAYLRADPTKEMLPLLDETWDLQFQKDERDTINIGFFIAKTNTRTATLWDDAFNTWKISQLHDQRIVDRLVRDPEYVERHGLSHIFLNPQAFSNYVEIDFEGHYGNQDVLDSFTSSTCMLHMTCVDRGELKRYTAKYYGFWQDVNGYYSDPTRKFLTSTLDGTAEEIQKQMSILSHVAKQTERTLLPPEWVTVTFNGTRMERAFHRVVDLDSLMAARIDFVEPNYMHHAASYGAATSETMHVPVTAEVATVEDFIHAMAQWNSAKYIAVDNLQDLSAPSQIFDSTVRICERYADRKATCLSHCGNHNGTVAAPVPRVKVHP